MKRSHFWIMVLGLVLISPLLIYQNFRNVETTTFLTEGFEFLSPFEGEVISLKETGIPFWIESNRTFSATLDIQDSNGNTLQTLNIPIEVGENEFYLTVNGSVQKHRGGWLNAILRDGNQPIVSRRFGWGLSFITLGDNKSTNVHCELCTSQPSLNKFVTFFDGEGFIPATPTDSAMPGEFQNIWYYLGDLIWTTHQVPVAFINLGQAYARLKDWSDRGLFQKLENVKSFSMSSILFQHGESHLDSASREGYRTELYDLIYHVRELFEYEVPWIISRSSRCGETEPKAIYEIESAQNDVIANMGLANVFPGPNANQSFHHCNFETLDQLRAYANDWHRTILNSGLFAGYLRNPW